MKYNKFCFNNFVYSNAKLTPNLFLSLSGIPTESWLAKSPPLVSARISSIISVRSLKTILTQIRNQRGTM